jgi:hypothetical protein
LAKLENVKILDMVNGEPTRVEYNGEIYEKANGIAKSGDLVRVADDVYITDVTEGGFYEIYADEHGDLAFDDDIGDDRDYDVWTDELETFRKVPAQPQPDLAERIAELERRIAALEGRGKRLTVGDYARVIANESDHYAEIGDIVKIVYDDKDYQPYKCELLDGENAGWFCESELVPVTDEEVAQVKSEDQPKYRKVIDRDPRVGDYVKFDEAPRSYLTSGKYYEIVEIDYFGAPQIIDDDDDVFDTDGLEFEVYELVAEGAPKFEVGDYAKVISVSSAMRGFDEGDIVKVTGVNVGGKYGTEIENEDGIVGFGKVGEHIVPATDEEIRWAKIDRKPGEFKKGDIVRVKGSDAGLPIGTIGEIIGIDFDGDLDVSNGVNSRYHGTDQVELICPAEHRFDREGDNV